MNTQQSIIENNKLIAEFMGFEPITLSEFDNNGFTSQKQMIIDVKDCAYSSSWDWLMPVIDRITRLGIEHNEILFKQIGDSLNTINIANTYNHTVNYIKWYNENEKF